MSEMDYTNLYQCRTPTGTWDGLHSDGRTQHNNQEMAVYRTAISGLVQDIQFGPTDATLL